jgi:murein DD-endopeptidase MepM/ murein hydrolase activator NlpD
MQGGVAVLARAGTGLGKVLFGGACALLLGLVAAPDAGAQTVPVPPVPAFASPFTCGQVWFARTYPGHPQFAVDWNLPGSGEADFGQPVFAGAPGVVTVDNNAGYGQMVTIDHGDGWTSLYAHLSAVMVATGDRVTAASMIGNVGRTGRADGSHLHQEQALNGVRQPIVVDGHPVEATFSSRGASYASANCPSRSRRWAAARWRAAARKAATEAPAAAPERLGRPPMRPLP